MISGGGRCNVTTAITDKRELMKQYPRGAKWLRYALYEFPPEFVYSWFEDRGVRLKCEGPKVFPVSNNGKDVIGVFEKLFANDMVQVRLNSSVNLVRKVGEKFELKTDERVEIFDRLVLTTGGNAYHKTGSTGDGYAFAQDLGHTVTDLRASLTSFVTKEKWVKDLSGVSFENVSFKLVGESCKYEFSGPFLFTHFGVSGPALFAIAAQSAYEEISPDAPRSMFVDFLPKLSYQDLQEDITKRFSGNASVFNSLMGFVPKSFLSQILLILAIDPQRKANELGKKDINRILESLKNFKLNLVGRTPGAEIVTAGGVDLSEVDQKTMESKICPGLYFAGELLDIDGFTGGFNLQVAWCTGRLAGESALR